MDLDGDPTGGGSGGPEAPAAISCFGACTVTAGAAKDAPISGRNHPVADHGCSGNSCWVDPYPSGENSFAVPSVYLTDYAGSTVASQGGNGNGNGGGGKSPFVGQDKSYADIGDDANQYYTSGSDKDSGSVWTPNDFVDDDEGNSTVPESDYFVGDSEGAIINQAMERGGSDFGLDPNDRKVTLIDTNTTNLATDPLMALW